MTDKELLNQAVVSVTQTLRSEGFNVKVAKPKQKPFYYLVCAWVDENESNEFEEFDDRKEAFNRARRILIDEPKYKFVEVKKFKTTTRDLVCCWRYRMIGFNLALVETW